MKPVVKNVGDLDILDDVWIEENGEFLKGWIWDISRRCITVVYGNDLRDFKFRIPKPSNVTEIKQGNLTLYSYENNNVSS